MPKASLKRKRSPYRPTAYDRRSTDLPFNGNVALEEVDCPLQHGDRIQVIRSLRDDPLGAMRAKDQITPDQYVAGRHLQAALENSEIGSVRAIDPSKEAVDGGSLPEVLTDTQRRALQDVRIAREHLGFDGYRLAFEVLGRRMSIADVAASRGEFSERGRRYLGRRFLECLEALSERFGYRRGKAFEQRIVVAEARG